VRGRIIGASAAVVLALLSAVGSTAVTAETTLPPDSTWPVGSVPDTSTTSTSTSTSTSTTTTLPSAVTTVPEGCALPPPAQAVFTGRLTAVDPVTATFTVEYARAGSLEGYTENDGTVQVRYGADVKFLEVGREYIIGVALDPVTQQLSSTVRDGADLFGGNEVVGGGADCPTFEAVDRTLNLDGTSIESGVFSNFLGDPLRLLAAVVLPFVLVVVALVAAVWVRRGLRR
jgi:hypothetical protein